MWKSKAAIQAELARALEENTRLNKLNDTIIAQVNEHQERADELETKVENLNGQLLALECSIPDLEWAARLGFQVLHRNSSPTSLAGRVASEIRLLLKGKTEFIGAERGEPLVAEVIQ